MTLTTTPPIAANPYVAPKDESALPRPKPAEDPSVTSYFKAFCRWTLICSVSAISSFILGLTFGTEGESAAVQALAMATGIVCFSFAYAMLDQTRFWRGLMANPVTRKSIYWAYGIRMVASVIFPIGAFNDTCVFMFGIGCMVSWMEWIGVPIGGEQWSEQLVFFVLTVTQGIALNLQMVIAVATFATFGRAFTKPTMATERFIGGESRVLKVD